MLDNHKIDERYVGIVVSRNVDGPGRVGPREHRDVPWTAVGFIFHREERLKKY